GSSNVLTLDHPRDSGGIRGSPNSETSSFSVKSLQYDGSTPLAYAARINVDTTTALATVPPRIRAGLGCWENHERFRSAMYGKSMASLTRSLRRASHALPKTWFSSTRSRNHIARATALNVQLASNPRCSSACLA